MAEFIWSIKREDFPGEGTLEDKIKFVLSYAILAPSTHNSQPWLFKIRGNSCKIFINPKLKLPEADVKERDLYISMGCMLENLYIASNYFGIFENIDIQPDRDFIGEVFFNNNGKRDNNLQILLDTIPRRVNARGVFEDRSLPENIETELSRLNSSNDIKLTFIRDKNKVEELATLTAQGLRWAYKKQSFRKEMSGWMHNSLTFSKDGMPGYSLRMPFLMSFFIPSLVRLFDMSPLLAKLNYKSLTSAPFICVFSSSKEDPSNWIEIGRLAERCFLNLSSKNIKTSIFVASIEMGDLYKKVQNILNENLAPQFLFCAGYMDYQLQHSPRHSLESKLIS